MSDTCPLHDEIITDIRNDIKEIKDKNEKMATEINSKVPSRLLYALIGIAMTLFTFFGGAQLWSTRSLAVDVQSVNKSVVEITTNQKHFKEKQDLIRKDVEDIKKNTKK